MTTPKSQTERPFSLSNERSASSGSYSLLPATALVSALELAESAAAYGAADQFDGFETFDA